MVAKFGFVENTRRLFQFLNVSWFVFYFDFLNIESISSLSLLLLKLSMFENFSGKKMLPKNIDSYTVAQCDFFAVESLVQTSERPAMRTIEPMNAVIFQRKLSRDIKWRENF